MIENCDFTANVKGNMRKYEDLGPFVQLLSSSRGQVGFQRCLCDGTYLIRIEPFSSESAEAMAPGLEGWTHPDICLTENRAFFSMLAEDDATCWQKLQDAVAAVMGEGVALLGSLADFNFSSVS